MHTVQNPLPLHDHARTWFTLSAAALALVSATHLGAVHAADLAITVHGVHSAAGEVLMAVYDQPSSFLKQPAYSQKAPAAERSSEQTVTLLFKDIPPGRYALSGFLDLNGNLSLDRNFMGVPTEAFGFSNGAIARFGPPQFDEAAIDVGAEPLTLDVHLR